MNKSTIVKTLIFCIIALILVFIGYPVVQETVLNKNSIPVSESLIFKKVLPEEAVNQLINHDIDVYLGAMSPEDAELLKKSGINIYTAPSQFFGLDFNPAPSTGNTLNPFSVKEFRFLVNKLINKQEIVDVVLKGYGSPKQVLIFDESPDYDLVRDVLDSYDLSYNFNEASEEINNIMDNLGGSKKEGKWYYKDNPVTIKIAIYTGTAYGEVKEVGEYIASKFEEIGFDVEKIYYDGSKESVLSQNPKNLSWNIKINTGIYFSASKFDDSAIISQAPFMKRLPGSSKDGAWNYENKELDIIGKKLFTGDYENEEEWIGLLRNGVSQIIENAYSIQLVTKQQIFAANKYVKGIDPSPYVGIRDLQNFRTMHIPYRDKVIIGTKETYKKDDPFNYYWFATNIYRMDMKQCLRDFPGWNNKENLEYEDMRWISEVVTAGPKEQLDIPSDAFIWNSDKQEWSEVGEGLLSTTKITFDLSNYIGSKWHDGSEISWTDILYTLYFNQESSRNEKWNSIADNDIESINKIKAYKIIDNNKLEIYIDTWHFNKGMVVSQATFTPNNWVLYAATNEIIYNNNTMMNTLSNGEKYGVPAMNLLNDNHINKVLDKVKEIDASNFIPIFTIGDKSYLNDLEIEKRKNNIKEWAAKHNNLIITDGPFYLDHYNSETEAVYLKSARN